MLYDFLDKRYHDQDHKNMAPWAMELSTTDMHSSKKCAIVVHTVTPGIDNSIDQISS